MNPGDAVNPGEAGEAWDAVNPGGRLGRRGIVASAGHVVEKQASGVQFGDVRPRGLPHFEFVHKAVGGDRIIWSVDHPYLAPDGTRARIEEPPVSHEDRERTTRLNAEKLFGL
ncbi:hypothetical protein ABZ719_27515 [Streptomyces sp. NPDC006743]|uniref:hypothetical protein n=1 Tax=Streptomyces sp. NPDC006743 TaxID=3154480 RepID=UPI0034550025